MNFELKEQISRGTFLFPFQLYSFKRNSGSLLAPYHWHSEIEILYFIKGNVFLTINGVRCIPQPGDIYFINSEEFHEIASPPILHHNDKLCLQSGPPPFGPSYDAKEEPAVFYYAYVFPLPFLNFEIYDYTQSKYLQRIQQKKLLFPRRLVPQDACYRSIQSEIKEIIKAHQRADNGYQILSKAALYKIIAYLACTDSFIKNEVDSPQYSEEKAKHLRQILSYITEHCSEKLTLSNVSSEFHMSSKYFSKYFKQNFGKNFVEYLNEARVENACIQLQKTEVPVMEVAFSAGFDNFSYFIKKFKEIMGCTPLTYRRQYHTI